MSESTRLLLVGCGNIAQQAHLPALRRLASSGELEICGVADLDAARAQSTAEQFAIPYHGTSWSEVAKRAEAQAISVCLPPGPNATVAVAALESGMHVLCEKPPGRTLAQAQAMASAAAASPELITMIAFNRRFAPLYRLGMDRSLRLGMPQAFYGRFTRASMGQAPSNTVSDWITSDGSHALDLAMATLGRPDAVAVTRTRAGAGPDNVWTLQLTSKQGGALLLFGFAAGRRQECFEWIGPGYDVRLELPERATWCAQGTLPEQWDSCSASGSKDFEVNYGFVGEYVAFVRAIRGEGPRPEADFGYGEFFMRLVDGVLAAKSGDCFTLSGLTPKDEATATPSFRVTRRPTDARPAVAVLQPPAAQQRYFNAESLSRLSSVAELATVNLEQPQSGSLAGTKVLLLGWGAPPLPVKWLESLPQLELVIVLGASVKWALPAGLLQDGNVAICNTADAIAASVAEHCLLLSLAGLRRLPELDAKMHRGQWPPQPNGLSLASLVKKARQLPGVEMLSPLVKPALAPVYQRVVAGSQQFPWNDLRGQTVGLIGWGHTAKRFVQLLQPFVCSILVHSSHADPKELEAFGVQRASLGEVMGTAKIVSLHKGQTEQNKGVIGHQELALLQKGSVFVNTARGGLVDEDALLGRARRGDVVFALDAFQSEPLPRRHPLRHLRNVILTPHSASSTPECGRRVGEEALRIARAWLQGEPIAALTREQLRTMT